MYLDLHLLFDKIRTIGRKGHSNFLMLQLAFSVLKGTLLVGN